MRRAMKIIQFRQEYADERSLSADGATYCRTRIL